MKQLLMLVLLIMPVVNLAAEQQQPAEKLESGNVFKGFLQKVWGKFKSLSPKDPRQTRKVVVATAGVRGAETTSSILEPYWKDDQTSDEQFLQQLQAFASAQEQIDKGELASAVTSLQAFMTQWPSSSLKPNAEFALAMAYGGQGDNQKSIQVFNQFVQEYPEHPLVADAKSVIQALK